MKETGIINKVIMRLPLIGRHYRKLLKEKQERADYKRNSCYPPGHFYSPIVSVEDIKKRESEIWKGREIDGIKEIDLQTDEQIKLLEQLSHYYAELPFAPEKKENTRYRLENDYYCYTDGIVLYSMMRHFKPGRIIEIGSGFSSAVMLDTNERFFNNKIQLTFIEPYPERLFSLMNEKDKASVSIRESAIQSIHPDEFKKLEAGDILFVDSSHVVKTGSDVHYILFEILPVLNSGVLIHFHDVFYPFEYPKEWVLGGRNWNEDYFLRAFLMYNNKFKIRLFSDFIHKHRKEAFAGMPLCYKNTGGNLWLEKK